MNSLSINKFSVLLSLYDGEKTDNFNQAMNSIWNTSSLKPNEIILVIDGPIRKNLANAVDLWKEKISSLKVIFIAENVGLGDALNIGLEKCNNEIIARMDTDDICREDRFEKQLKVFIEITEIDICSSWVNEFEKNENLIISQRKIPKSHKDIIKYAKTRNPINHPAVMYKKSAVIKAGSYKKMQWFEDYYLWTRMILNGAIFYNIQDPLVSMRAGNDQLERRSGLEYAKAEFVFFNRLFNIGFLTYSQFLKNTILRLSVRLVPKKIISLIYKRFLRN